MMTNDRKITISVGSSRKATRWQGQTLWLSELYQRLQTPVRGTETYAEYMALRKPQQDEKKDVGGFVAGSLRGTRRKADEVTGRDVLTLDLDNLPPGGADDVLRRLSGLGCGWCVYSTRKHSPQSPRLRVLIAVDRTTTPDEYEPAARRVAQLIQPEMTWFDQTTFEASRLMYYPSCCADSEYLYRWEDKPFASVDGILEQYASWRDMSSWAQVPGAQEGHARLVAKQANPTEKPGVVGAFCRVYDIPCAIDTFLPGVYDLEEDDPSRYTFTGGSTTGGAVVYDEGKWLYSHHATDPCSGRLVNAFDLVRLHLFGALDDTDSVRPDTPANKRPSFIEMSRRAVADEAVTVLMAQERYECLADFDAVAEAAQAPKTPPSDFEWMKKLRVNPNTGKADGTMDNIWIILEHDPRLVGRFALNEFAGRGEVLGALPWNEQKTRRFWEDNDTQGLYWYIEKVYQITGPAKVDGALSLHSSHHAFNDAVDYLNSLYWDGVPRLDTLLVDYLGAEDSPYTRAVTRKMCAAAVARALKPGIKFDTMMILSGPQGIGKSTLLSIMSRGWFNDSIRSFEGKDASELLQGVWLVEIGELDAFRRSDINRVKQFLSLQDDRYRAAYGRHVKVQPRRCVFFGTTNTTEFLKDKTGGRRFWPVDVGVQPAKKNIWSELEADTTHIWAEAVVQYRLGEALFLTGALEKVAREVQENHREQSVQEGIIRDFLGQPIPRNWNSWELTRRRMFWQGNAGEVVGELVPRTKVCALEIWCEALEQDVRFIRNTDSAEINAIVAMLPEWERMRYPDAFGYCKNQRGFRKSPTKRL